jgi:hypothetical protein
VTSSEGDSTETEAPETTVHRYSREHPHFIRNYLLSIALSLVLGVLLFYFIGGSRIGEEDRLSQVSGAVTLSESQLVHVVKKSGVIAYWLGPISGSKYTLVVSKKGEAIITYLPNGQGIEKPGERRLIVATDTNSHSVGPLVSSETEVTNMKDSTPGGAFYSYDRYSPDYVIISLSSKRGHVRIYYPSTRTPSNIQLDAESLILIS